MRHCLFLLCFFSILKTWAQPSQSPIRYLPEQTNHFRRAQTYADSHKGEFIRNTVTADDTLLDLPVFDDFSDSYLTPKLSLWLSNSGVFVGDRFTYHPPSKGVVSFDGIRANGLPYNTNLNAIGPCDTLTSHPVRLGAVTGPQVNQVYLTFFAQPGHPKVVEFRPDTTDSLIVQFLAPPPDTTGWHTYGKFPGGQADANFHFRSVQVPADQCRDGFRFRFINYGRQNGSFDVWNLDYIILDVHESGVDSTYADVALSGPLPGYFGRYRAIPVDHYNDSKAAAVSSTLTARVNNLNEGLVVFDEEFRADSLTENPAQPIGQNLLPPRLGAAAYSYAPAGIEGGKGDSVTASNANLATTNSLRGSGRFLYKVTLTGVQAGFNDVPTNDFLTDTATLINYYAEDDNSGELIHTVTGNSAFLLTKIYPLEAGTLTGVEIGFDQLSFSDTTQYPEVLVYVYRFLSGIDSPLPKDSNLIVQPYVLTPTNEGTYKFAFNRGVPVPNAPYYIGYRQGPSVNQQLYIKADINSAQSDIYLNYAGTWQKDNVLVGAPIIRPIYQCALCPVATRPMLRREALALSPNPVAPGGSLRLGGSYSRLCLTAADGRRITLAATMEGGHCTVALAPTLPPGLYALEAWPIAGAPVAGRLVVR